MFNLLKRRPQLSKQEATQVAEAILPVYLARYPGMFPVEYATLLYKETAEYKNCWVLYWNSKRYAETNNSRDQWVGPGPILVDKWTGHIRIYPSGHNLQDILNEYDDDVAAAGRAWVICVSFNTPKRSEVLARLKSELGLSLQEMATLKQRLPGPLFTGHRLGLEWLAEKLRAAGIPCKVKLYDAETVAELEWVIPRTYLSSAAEALSKSREIPEPRGGWRGNFQEFVCPIPEIAMRCETPPQRAFQEKDDDP